MHLRNSAIAFTLVTLTSVAAARGPTLSMSWSTGPSYTPAPSRTVTALVSVSVPTGYRVTVTVKCWRQDPGSNPPTYTPVLMSATPLSGPGTWSSIGLGAGTTLLVPGNYFCTADLTGTDASGNPITPINLSSTLTTVP